MARDCVGFEDCDSCLQAKTVKICLLNDRIQFRCKYCNVRTTATFTDPRVEPRLCVGCYHD